MKICLLLVGDACKHHKSKQVKRLNSDRVKESSTFSVYLLNPLWSQDKYVTISPEMSSIEIAEWSNVNAP